MSNINRVVVVGRLTRDPELKYTQSGIAVCQFSIASNDYAGQDKDDKVYFFEVVAWGKRGEAIAEYFKKGDPICVEGKLIQQRWEDPEGNKRSKVLIQLQNFEFMKQKGKSSDPTPDEPPQPPQSRETVPDSHGYDPGDQPFSDDDIPF